MGTATRRCAITGTSGLVGSALASHLSTSGWDILTLNRSGAPTGAHRFVLGDDIEPDLFRGADALVHVAHDFRVATWPEMLRVNVDGSIKLLDAAREAGVERIVFISTVSAFTGCVSLYGKGKLLVEQRVNAFGGFVIRPGLVHGSDREAGMYGRLDRLTRLPVLPVFSGGHQPMVLVHVRDLSLAVEAALTHAIPREARLLTAAHREPVAFADLLRTMAQRRGRRVRCVSVPGSLALGALRFLEAVGLGPGFRSDSLLSLLNPDPSPDFTTQETWGVTFRAYSGTDRGA